MHNKLQNDIFLGILWKTIWIGQSWIFISNLSFSIKYSIKFYQREFFYVKRLLKLIRVYEYRSIKIISNHEQDLEVIINRKIIKKKLQFNIFSTKQRKEKKIKYSWSWISVLHTSFLTLKDFKINFAGYPTIFTEENFDKKHFYDEKLAFPWTIYRNTPFVQHFSNTLIRLRWHVHFCAYNSA